MLGQLKISNPTSLDGHRTPGLRSGVAIVVLSHWFRSNDTAQGKELDTVHLQRIFAFRLPTCASRDRVSARGWEKPTTLQHNIPATPST